MTKALTRTTGMLPSVFEDFMKPWNEWFENGSLSGKMLTVPAVNIKENKEGFELSVAVPGMKKEDFVIDVEGNLLTLSAEKEETKEEHDEKMTRQEYNFSSFARTFTLPDDVKKDDIQASYNDGILKVAIPKHENAKKMSTIKHIAVK